MILKRPLANHRERDKEIVETGADSSGRSTRISPARSMGCPIFLNDFGEGPQGFIDFRSARKHGGYVRLKHHNVAAGREAGRELIGHRTTEVVLRKNLFAINFGRRCFTALVLHNLSVLDASPAVRRSTESCRRVPRT